MFISKKRLEEIQQEARDIGFEQGNVSANTKLYDKGFAEGKRAAELKDVNAILYNERNTFIRDLRAKVLSKPTAALCELLSEYDNPAMQLANNTWAAR